MTVRLFAALLHLGALLLLSACGGSPPPAAPDSVPPPPLEGSLFVTLSPDGKMQVSVKNCRRGWTEYPSCLEGDDDCLVIQRQDPPMLCPAFPLESGKASVIEVEWVSPTTVAVRRLSSDGLRHDLFYDVAKDDFVGAEPGPAN